MIREIEMRKRTMKKIIAQERDRNNKTKERRKKGQKNKNLLCPVRAHSHCTSLLLPVAECHNSLTISEV
jgi:hypothetical protein